MFTVHGFVNSTHTVREGERVDTLFQSNVKGNTTFATLGLLGVISADPITTGTSLLLLALQSIQYITK